MAKCRLYENRQINRVLAEVATHRYPERDRVMVLLSVKAGLRAKEIAMVTWGMVTDAEGNVGGADTAPVEVTPNPDPLLSLPIHQMALVNYGVHLLENLKLDELARTFTNSRSSCSRSSLR